MGAKKAKLHIEITDTDNIRLNFAISKDAQPRKDESEYTLLKPIELDCSKFDFSSQKRESEENNLIKEIAKKIDDQVVEIEKHHTCEFDESPKYLTISSKYFKIFYIPPYPQVAFQEADITITDEWINKTKKSVIDHLSAVDSYGREKIETLINDNFFIERKNGSKYRTNDPQKSMAIRIAQDATMIMTNSLWFKLKNFLENHHNFKKINISLATRKEFTALAGEEEKSGKVGFINIKDEITEISLWENGELKDIMCANIGLGKLKEIIWRLCIFYQKNAIKNDFESIKQIGLKVFYESLKNAEIKDTTLIESNDCEKLFEAASCILDIDPDHTHLVPKTNLTMSNYALSGITIEAVKHIFAEIKKWLDKNEFCKIDRILFECNLPFNGVDKLKGIDKLAEEFFEMPARMGIAKWNGEICEEISPAGIGALHSQIIKEKITKKSDKPSEEQKVPPKGDTTLIAALNNTIKKLFSKDTENLSSEG